MSTSDLAREVDFHRDRVAQLEVERDELRLQLTEAEASMLNLEWRLGEAKAAVTEETWRANRAEAALAELRPAAASEDWHREYGRVLVRVMRERDEARARVGTPPAQPTIPPDAELAEAVREWRGQFRPGSYMSPQAERLAAALDTQLADINAQVAADKRVLDAAEALCRAFRLPVDADPLDEALALRAVADAKRELVAAVDARRALTGEPSEVSEKKRAEVEAELFRAGIVPGACPACRSTASAHLCSTDEVAAELETLQHLTRRRDGDDV